MFLPYRTDLEFNRFPVMTFVVCALCIFVFVRQEHSDAQVLDSAARYCQQDQPRSFWVTMKKIAGDAAIQACPTILAEIYTSPHPDKIIDALAKHALPWDLMSAERSRERTADQLNTAFDEFKENVKPSLTAELMYDPSTYNVWRMITAAFAHGSWSHIIGNLFFFYAFATTVEIIIGSLGFSIMIVGLAIGTHVCYSITQHLVHSAVPTLGLSGVVMGVIGLFVYLAPAARIRCFLWLLVFWRVLRIPAWLLATWYVGWDVYNLTHGDGSSHINLVAHVSGAALGLLAGLVFFRSRKEWVREQLA